jgi:hypothetical protein
MSTRYFGLPLSEIVRREKHNVPSIVVNVTDHICKQGIEFYIINVLLLQYPFKTSLIGSLCLV